MPSSSASPPAGSASLARVAADVAQLAGPRVGVGKDDLVAAGEARHDRPPTRGYARQRPAVVAVSGATETAGRASITSQKPMPVSERETAGRVSIASQKPRLAS